MPQSHTRDPPRTFSPTCWPAGCHSGWWSHRGSRTAGGCCLWGHREGWGLSGAAPPGSPWASSLACRRGQLTLSIAAVREVLALHDLLHDVISVNPRVIHPGRVALHGVLLPPGAGRGRVTTVRAATGTTTQGRAPTALRMLQVPVRAAPDCVHFTLTSNPTCGRCYDLVLHRRPRRP